MTCEVKENKAIIGVEYHFALSYYEIYFAVLTALQDT